MLSFRIFNKSKPETLLLIHGLFASAGYWLTYLKTLKEYRLILLDIDYRDVHDLDQYVRMIQEIIQTKAGGRVFALISHSLGSLIASKLPQSLRQLSLELCPVYLASRQNEDMFVAEIEKKIKYSMSRDEIHGVLANVNAALYSYRIPEERLNGQYLFLPDADPYFSYNPRTEFTEFRGDHFDIAEGMIEIRRVLGT